MDLINENILKVKDKTTLDFNNKLDPNLNYYLLINNKIKKLIINLSNQKLNLTIIFLNNKKTNLNLIFNLFNNSSLNLNQIIINANLNLDEEINLNSENNTVNKKIYSLSKNYHQNLNFNYNNKFKNTKSFQELNFYSLLNSKIKVNCSGNVINNSANSTNIQKLNGLIFDSGDINLNPILRINENNVIAKHSATIGFLDNESIFYLNSRGLSLTEIRKLILIEFENQINKIEDKKIIKIINKVWENCVSL